MDGQQRLTTIKEFLDGKFACSKHNAKYGGMHFNDLPEDAQDAFLAYSVPVTTLLQATQDEILEMFRRMNSFTVPLNDAEKRHSEFHGQFKSLITILTDNYSPFLNNFAILTEKQIIRMADAEFFTDVIDTIVNGVKNRQPASFRKLYKDHDVDFPEFDATFHKISQVVDFIKSDLHDIRGTYFCKGYAFHSLVTALVHNKWGIANGESTLERKTLGAFTKSRDAALQGLLSLASAHEHNEIDGPFGEYVHACLSTTHRIPQRRTRTKWILDALNGEI